jgi:hypothetical protein
MRSLTIAVHLDKGPAERDARHLADTLVAGDQRMKASAVQSSKEAAAAREKNIEDVAREMGRGCEQELAALRRVAQQGEATGKQVAAGAQRGAKGLKDAGDEAAGFGDQLLNLAKGQMALATVQQLAGAISDTMQHAAEFVRTAVGHFADLQKQLQGIAALSGRPNTNEFTVEQAQLAEKANLKPEQLKEFREAFLSRASNYVGKGPNAKLTDEEGEQVVQSAAEYAAQHGVSQSEMGGFIGGLLAQKRGKTTAAEMKAEAGKVFATLEASSAPVAHLLPAMTRVQAQGFSPAGAASLIAQLPEIRPEEEASSALRVASEVRRNMLEGKGEQFGIKAGANIETALDQVIENLAARQKKGEDLDKMLRAFSHEEIAQQTMRGLVMQGPEGRATWKGLIERTPANALEQSIEAGRQTDAGRRMARESQAAAAEIERGAVFDRAQAVLDEAKTRLTREGAFEQNPGLGTLIRGGTGKITGVDVQEQRINQEALASVYGRARQAGIPVGTGLGVPLSVDAAVTAAAHSQIEVLNEIRTLLKAIDDKAAREEQRANQAGGQRGMPPAAMPARPVQQGSRP